MSRQIISEVSGITSHLAILARSYSIPAVISLNKPRKRFQYEIL